MLIHKFTTKEPTTGKIQTLYVRAQNEKDAAAALAIYYNREPSEFRYNPNLPYLVRTKIFNKEEGYELIIDLTDKKFTELAKQVKTTEVTTKDMQIYSKQESNKTEGEQFIDDIKNLFAHNLQQLKQYWGDLDEDNPALANTIFENMVSHANKQDLNDYHVDLDKDITVSDILYSYESNRAYR